MLALAILLVLNFASPAAAQEIRYLYDELNRLIGVIDPQGNAAVYVYDAVGNILQIKRFTVDPSADVSITLVRPSRGAPGETVQLFGRGFSPTPGDNQVTFNGTAATVGAATATSVTVTVPAGATTGPIALRSPLGSATSPEPFTVVGAFAVEPAQADVALGGVVDFRATLGGAPVSDVTWRVNGVVGGNPSLGTITTAGTYTAPSVPPSVQPVPIEAVLTADPSSIARASVRVVGQVSGNAAAGPVSVARTSLSSQALAAPVTVAPTPASGARALGGPVTVGPTPATAARELSGPVTVTAGPVLTGVVPATGAPGAVLALTLSGANLHGATAVQALSNGVVDPTLTVSAVSAAPDGTSVAGTLTIGATATTGARVLQVTTPQGRTIPFDLGSNRFTVTTP